MTSERAWQAGDVVWAHIGGTASCVWERFRDGDGWYDTTATMNITDEDVTAAGAVLVATANGPVGHFHDGRTFCEGCVRFAAQLASEGLGDETAAARAAVRQARALHAQFIWRTEDGRPVLATCKECGKPWPCSTVAALGEVAGRDEGAA